MGIRIAYAAVAVVALACLSAAFLIGNSWKPSPGAPGGFVKAVYGAVPLTEDRAANLTELFRLIDASGSDTYNCLVREPAKDMERLRAILPLAKEKGISVWATIAPPSEISPEHRNDMEYVDYMGWARKFAELSLEHDNLEAWSIDNVLVDYQFFTDGYLEEITGAAKGINPGLRFIPVVYYPNVVSPAFESRSRHFDGIQLYYTNFPPGESDETGVLLPMLEEVRKRFGGPVILGIYASPWSRDMPTSPEYVGQLITLAKENADGVMIYTIQQEGEKLAVIKRLFGE